MSQEHARQPEPCGVIITRRSQIPLDQIGQDYDGDDNECATSEINAITRFRSALRQRRAEAWSKLAAAIRQRASPTSRTSLALTR